ncbi:hypothetical protein [Arthrobacter bambusae]|uniref:hypothetical protein n=1 Tax=Arthrobacter bambusae TaxID=1338426 RepID=UPI002780C217|nr:hypothetical protein [Arthrobacter bambusae]MDQ0031662.1 MFS family permease [Arthrobacter bambusae]MDQ0099886.1 MFS family permease [Arthrobacter bambusae]
MAPRLEINAANAELLPAVFGLGSLAGSMALMIAPLRGSAEKAVIRLAAVTGLAFAGAALVPSFPSALVAFGVSGVLNSLFFTAALAARAEFSSPNARAQVFIWTAALKVTAAAAGTALAGAIISLDARLPLIAGGALAIAAAAAARVETRGASPESTILHELPRENWPVAGITPAESGQNESA